jgi:hypothetical protein
MRKIRRLRAPRSLVAARVEAMLRKRGGVRRASYACAREAVRPSILPNHSPPATTLAAEVVTLMLELDSAVECDVAAD